MNTNNKEETVEESKANEQETVQDLFEEYRALDAEVTSNLRDIAAVDLNGTQIKLVQHSRHTPMIVEVYVGSEELPLGTINIAKEETVSLGGVEEHLAKRVDEIRELPVDEIPDALDELAQRLNPIDEETQI